MLDEQLVEQPVSAIYRATDEKTGNTVFLVSIESDAATSELADRFLRRAKTAAQLEHENILPILDYGKDEYRPYATFSYREGDFLVDVPYFQTAPNLADKDQVIKVIDLVKQLAAALATAHPTGLIHHDLRPENIFVDKTGKPFFLDLVVPPTPPPTPAEANDGQQQLDYQSPEQLAGKSLSGKSNIYSLGILLYRLLAGQLPPLPLSEWDIFEHKGMAREIPLPEMCPGLTEATYVAVENSIWPKDWSRYETAADQQKALERAMAAEAAPPLPPPPAWLLLTRRLKQPETLKFVVPAIVVVVLLTLVLLWARGNVRQDDTVAPTRDMVVVPAQEQTAEPSTTLDTAVQTEEEQEAIALPTVSATATQPPTDTVVPTETVVPAAATEIPPTDTPAPEPTNTATSIPTSEPTVEPTQEVACVPSPPFGWVRYTIQANDSLSAIGQATNTTVEQLLEVNCLDGTLLSIGQEIWVRFVPNPTVTNTPLPETAVPIVPGTDPGSNPTPVPPTPTVAVP
ncbi:MAG: protein kinase [Ardenticatenaceae bacterium]|nr:protein kinase [Ardenticatenaceae bacterium]